MSALIVAVLLFFVYVIVPFLVFTWTVALYARLDAEDARAARPGAEPDLYPPPAKPG